MIDRTGHVRRLVAGVGAVFVLEIRRLARSRAALVVTFLSPVVITTIVVFALGSTEDMAPSRIGWVATSDAPAVDVFVDEVVENPELADFVEWVEVPDVASARADVAAVELGAAVTIGAPPQPGSPPHLAVIGDEDPIAAGIAATVVDEFVVRFTASVVAFEHGVAAPEVGDSLTVVAPGGRSLDAAVHWGPALGAFLVLLAMGHPAHRQVDDRNRGIAGRTASTSTPRSALSIGRALAATATGAAALATMALSTQLIFGRAWGPAPLVLLLIVATAVAVAGIGSIIATFARTGGQAQTLTAVVSFGLAIGGGSFTPLGSSGASTNLTRWLPTSLSLDGFSAAATTGALADAATPVVALLLIGAVFLGSAALVSNREVTA